MLVENVNFCQALPSVRIAGLFLSTYYTDCTDFFLTTNSTNITNIFLSPDEPDEPDGWRNVMSGSSGLSGDYN